MISVVVSLYNVENYIEKCLKSILAQTFHDFEVVIVDDGSTDEGLRICEELLKKEMHRYKIIRKENGGQSSARNCGLKNSEGDYVVFIDSDDVIAADFLQRLYDALDEESDLSFCGFRYVKEQIPPEDDNKDRLVFDRNELLDRFLKRTIDFVVPSMLFRREFLIKENLFFREDIRYSEDQLFIWEVFFKAKKAVYLPRKMYGYYLREKSIMTSSPYEKIVKGYEVFDSFCRELEEKYPEDRKTIRMILPRWDLGTLYSSASLLDFEEYRKIYKMMDGRKILSQIAGINEPKAYLLAGVSAVSDRLLYALCKRMDLNG